MHGPIFDSLSAAKQADGTYDFSSVFRYIGDYMQAADFSVANLETTLRGSDMAYSGWPNFNCPDNIVESAKNAVMTSSPPKEWLPTTMKCCRTSRNATISTAIERHLRSDRLPTPSCSTTAP